MTNYKGALPPNPTQKQAAEESAQYTIKRIDPGAPTYSLDFLRKHPEISTESVPWHVHTDLMHAASGGAGQP